MVDYVVHYCRNKECNNAWIDTDKTKVKDYPPHWKYCRECCEKLGIDFDKQTTKSNASSKQLEAYAKGKENLKSNK